MGTTYRGTKKTVSKSRAYYVVALHMAPVYGAARGGFSFCHMVPCNGVVVPAGNVDTPGVAAVLQRGFSKAITRGLPDIDFASWSANVVVG